jgi:hypothetical protein
LLFQARELWPNGSGFQGESGQRESGSRQVIDVVSTILPLGPTVAKKPKLPRSDHEKVLRLTLDQGGRPGLCRWSPSRPVVMPKTGLCGFMRSCVRAAILIDRVEPKFAGQFGDLL